MKKSKRKPSHFLTNCSALGVVVGLFAVSANAAPSKSPTLTPKEEKAAAAVQASQESTARGGTNGKSKLLWNSWYTMTIGEKIPYGYYNDRVERRDGKIAYQNQLWRSEEGFINEEKVVSFGKDDENVTPLLFNFNGIYRESEINIDGTFTGTTLKVKARRNKQALPPVEASVSSKAFLSTLFQAWIGKHLAGLTPGKRLPFVTLFEDLGLDNHYAPINGSITLEGDDDFAKKTGTKKLSVETADEKSIWHVLPSGEAVRIEKPGQHLVIEKKTEAEARRFLVKRTDKPE
jgi:hypothetical protein